MRYSLFQIIMSGYGLKDGKAPAEEAVIHRIRITLTSRNVKSLEKGVYWNMSCIL